MPDQRSGRSPVAVVGAGALADAVAGRLAGAYRLEVIRPAGDPVGCRAVVSVREAGVPGPHRTVEASWLPVRVEPDQVLIGPATPPGTRGCAACVDTRRRDADASAAGHPGTGRTPEPAAGSGQRAVPAAGSGQRAVPAAGSGQRAVPAAAPAVRAVSAVVADELHRLLAAPERPRSRRRLLRIGLRRLEVDVRAFLPDPSCPVCGRLPADTADAARLALHPRRKLRPDRPRVREVDERELLDTYVDAETGLVVDLSAFPENAFPFTRAQLAGRDGEPADAGYARSGDYRSGRVVAVAEALERLGGHRPAGRRTVVRGTYRELCGDALDPRVLGLYPDSWYDRPGFPFLRFHEDLELRWVWGHSFARDRPILVPESVAYPGLSRLRGGGPALVEETTNGTALGGCVEEAVLHGLLEVAERDAFLMTWYARLPAPRVELGSLDTRTRLVVERLEFRHGVRVHAFCTTLEHGVPTFWVMAEDRTGHPGRPMVVCAGGSGLDATGALRGAMYELAQSVEYAQLLTGWQPGLARRLADRPELVRTMADHILAAAYPAAFDRFDFLPGPETAQPLASLADRWHQPHPDNLTTDLTTLIGRYLTTTTDVIAVNQTTPDHTATGLHTVKVLVPGTLSMTFGHHTRRTHDLPRLTHHLRGADPNPHPHPFP